MNVSTCRHGVSGHGVSGHGVSGRGWASALLIFFFVSVLAVAPGTAPVAAAAAPSQVQLILDASGSMWNKLDDGRFRIVAAKEAVNGFVDGLPDEGLNVGLRIYGSKIKAGQDGACRDSKLFVPMAGVDRGALKGAVDGAKAIGATPIAWSLEQAAGDFKAGDGAKLIVLVTDGKESCDGDLKAAAARLKGIGLKIIGFDLEDEAAASFQGLGTFENASDAKALASALGRAVSEVVPPLGDAALEAPAEVSASAPLEVKWTGPGGKLDYVTIVPKSYKDGRWKDWQYVAKGNPLTFAAPLQPGDYEIRYQSERVPGVAARRALKVVAAEFALDAPAQAAAGSRIEVSWVGPNGAGDYVTIVPKDAPVGEYASYFYTKDGSPGGLDVALAPGEYAVRYQSEREEAIYAAVPIKVGPPEVTLEAPDAVPAGKPFEVKWSGPGLSQDWITIVAPSAGPADYASYKYLFSDAPVTLDAPKEPGTYELRYVSDRVQGVFVRRPIRVE